MQKFLVVTNPNSAGGHSTVRAEKFKGLLESHGLSYNEVHSSSLAECLSLVEQELQLHQYQAVIAIGGDGLIHHLLEPVTTVDVPLHIVPAGSGNDCARALGMFKLSDSDRVRILISGTALTIDLGEIISGSSHKLFLQIASSGFDAQVNHHANLHPNYPPSIKYLLSTLALIWKAKPQEYIYGIDGAECGRVSAMLFLAANGRNYGGGMKIAPHAKNDDQQLELMYVLPAKPLELLLVFPLVYLGLHIKHPKVRFMSARSMELSGPGSIFADGEQCANMPALVRISERKLTILGP